MAVYLGQQVSGGLFLLVSLAILFGMTAIVVGGAILLGRNVDRDLLAENNLAPDYFPPSLARMHEDRGWKA